MTISKPTIPNQGNSTSLQADRLAKTSVSLESNEELVESDPLSGLSNCACSRKVEQLSLFGKTSHPALTTDLEKFSGALPATGTIVNGQLSKHQTWGLPISGKEFFLLPTPMAYSSSNSRRPGQTKLEIKLRSLGILQQERVLSPVGVELMMGFPPNWTEV